VNRSIKSEAVGPIGSAIAVDMPAPSEIKRIEYARWADLVHCIEAGDAEGMAELYRFFWNGLRYHLCRNTGSQDLNDRLHNLFILIVEAIKRGDIRQPERLMGFVRTVTRRQVVAHIRHTVDAKVEIPLDFEIRLGSTEQNPEEAAILRQREVFVRFVMNELSGRDREVLTRFYIQEQSQATICGEMDLTETQFRLLKSRAKARFGELGKKNLRPRLCGSQITFGAGSRIKPSKSNVNMGFEASHLLPSIILIHEH
jgi:RNA polymerase sigma-70 factor (ECF subfamily)